MTDEIKLPENLTAEQTDLVIKAIDQARQIAASQREQKIFEKYGLENRTPLSELVAAEVKKYLAEKDTQDEQPKDFYNSPEMQAVVEQQRQTDEKEARDRKLADAAAKRHAEAMKRGRQGAVRPSDYPEDQIFYPSMAVEGKE